VRRACELLQGGWSGGRGPLAGSPLASHPLGDLAARARARRGLPLAMGLTPSASRLGRPFLVRTAGVRPGGAILYFKCQSSHPCLRCLRTNAGQC
jgi:hypothetical protein